MRKTKIILSLALALLFFFSFSQARLTDTKVKELEEQAQAESKQEKDISPAKEIIKPETVVQEKSFEPKDASFILVTDALDEFGGRASSANYSERISSGGQHGVVGISQGASFYGLQGYVHTAAFRHGDNNADGNVSVSDVVYQINYLFKGGPAPKPPEVGDVNCDNTGSVSDVVYSINYLFKGGPKPCNL